MQDCTVDANADNAAPDAKIEPFKAAKCFCDPAAAQLRLSPGDVQVYCM